MLRIQRAIECCGTWRHRCRLLVVVACWLGMLLAANEVWGQRRTDTIQLIEGAPLRGEVVRTTPDEVEVSQGGATRQVAVSEISQILFGDEPSARAAQGRCVEEAMGTGVAGAGSHQRR